MKSMTPKSGYLDVSDKICYEIRAQVYSISRGKIKNLKMGTMMPLGRIFVSIPSIRDETRELVRIFGENRFLVEFHHQDNNLPGFGVGALLA